ncbi:MAG: HAD family hydrolase [Nitriliruptor sp.]|uniref:HAD family hydrolase n=1 Tax=Nitriliruptor sp. TaxID=2448056 RepID=UPI0034A04EAA
MSDPGPSPETREVPLTDLDAPPDPFDELEDAVAAGGTPDPDGTAPRVVVFDVGEVLIDETRVWSCWAELLGVTPLTFAAVLGAAIVQGQDHEVVFPAIAPNVDWHDFEDEHERRYGGFREEDLHADVRPCLDELRALGFRVVIAGNQPVRRSAQLTALDLPCDDLVTSEELGAEKPDTDFFVRLLRRCDLTDPAEVLYIGDRVDNDIVPAHDAGLRTCWLTRGPWGHLQDLPDDVEPDIVLEGLGELPLLLSSWRDD